MTQVFRGFIHSDINSIQHFMECFLDCIRTYVSDPERLFDIRLITNELVINGVLHGNENDPSKQVELCAVCDDDQLMIKVVDEGPGIAYTLEDFDPQKCVDRGRGLRLVEKLSDDLQIEGNKVTCSLKW